jgi:hypothetical protein
MEICFGFYVYMYSLSKTHFKLLNFLEKIMYIPTFMFTRKILRKRICSLAGVKICFFDALIWLRTRHFLVFLTHAKKYILSSQNFVCNHRISRCTQVFFLDFLILQCASYAFFLVRAYTHIWDKTPPPDTYMLNYYFLILIFDLSLFTYYQTLGADQVES